MADVKISALPSATTPLAGTEVLPVVQGGATRKVSVADLTAGRSVDTDGLTANGNITLTGAARRITGDFSAATQANRLSFQTSTANTNTLVHALPNGTGQISGYSAFNNSDPTNAAYIRIIGTAADARIDANITGTGTYLPLTIYTGGAERMRVDTPGNVIAGGSVALATNATNGFLYVPTCAGIPTGTPTAITGMAPIVVDTTNNKLYFYSGGAWRDAGP